MNSTLYLEKPWRPLSFPYPIVCDSKYAKFDVDWFFEAPLSTEAHHLEPHQYLLAVFKIVRLSMSNNSLSLTIFCVYHYDIYQLSFILLSSFWLAFRWMVSQQNYLLWLWNWPFHCILVHDKGSKSYFHSSRFFKIGRHQFRSFSR